MQICVLSDLHLEFQPFELPKIDVDAIVLAGDTSVGFKGITWAREYLPEIPVVYVLGNHEYYGQVIPTYINKLREKVEGSKVHVLENDALLINDVVFLGCTLWTDFELFGNPRVAGYYATQSMTDYRKIRILPSYSKLRSIDTAGIHHRSQHWLEEQIEKYRGNKTVIITHHAPSTRSLPEGYEDEILSAAYASKLDEFIESSEATLWIHGHIHRQQDYLIGNTRIICNPRGYPGGSNPDFSPGYIVEV